MLKFFFGIIIILAIALASCSKTPGPSLIPTEEADEMFWTNSPIVGSGISVTVDSGGVLYQSGKITLQVNQPGNNVAPSCGYNGCYTIDDIDVGTYTYIATDGTNNWSGGFTITSNNIGHCNTELFTHP